ncbi:hypothetical protein GIB67_028706 [Kingdonia uniflora]|uniref:GH10 domain-containing protein n=1 Tax=Kingdonia uniflora TaxID=39325 RepID=A0A7J7NAI3_9MAGN|nr:hypothetical protein GIB67_028706 [Kingdonia uniflora]
MKISSYLPTKQTELASFKTWIKIKGADTSLVRATLATKNTKYISVGTVIASSGCWSFLKGGFVLDSPSSISNLTFQNSDVIGTDISFASSSLQPFSDEEWTINQQYKVYKERLRAVTIHVSDRHGNRLQGAQVTVEQISNEFPFGSAIAKTIIGNSPYQDWFVKRFNAAVFENELKWYATEPEQGKVNYTLADQMLEFTRANQIAVRGHNIFWEDPIYTPAWVRNLTGDQLKLAVNSRIQSLMNKYKEEFIHWDVSNEMLHFDFYEQRLGPNATLGFFETAHTSDPLTTLFMNDFNVVETSADVNSTVDSYIMRMKELLRDGVTMDGIGLEGHFSVPNLPLMRAVIDKLATLDLPIWLTEMDISNKFDEQTQAIYLEQVLREGFSHPSVNGMMLWSALHPYGCYRMCLTDNNLRNLPAGDVVDKLLQEWKTGARDGQSDGYGSYSFHGFLGEYSCKGYPEAPLYNGGILKDYYNQAADDLQTKRRIAAVNEPFFILQNLTQGTKYCFSTWIKIKAADTSLVRATLATNSSNDTCVGTVIASSGCWSFLKGGFVLNSPSSISNLSFQSSDVIGADISVASASLQPFSDEQWALNQQHKIYKERLRAATIHVSDTHGNRLLGAQVTVEQIANEFPFGSAIAETIIGNSPYQDWFVKRFNVAVFENELKWYATEPKQGKVNYTLADEMLKFTRANQIPVRGHNIFWENPTYNPAWVQNRTGDQLKLAVNLRIQSLMNKYKQEFLHWDVSNELLHFDFYEQRLGPNATLGFFETAHTSDPLATLFLNDFNVVETETCGDVNSTVDSYIMRMKEILRGGVTMDGIGLEAHFSVPNLPLMRAVLDKLATLDLPIWLTEMDIMHKFDEQTQAIYLEQVLREGFSHPSVNGMMLWSALHPNGCYRMCLTDNDLRNLPAGDVVDKLLQEWKTGTRDGQSDEYGLYSFRGFLGEYSVSARYGNRSFNSTFSLCNGDETKHFYIQL